MSETNPLVLLDFCAVGVSVVLALPRGLDSSAGVVVLVRVDAVLSAAAVVGVGVLGKVEDVASVEAVVCVAVPHGGACLAATQRQSVHWPASQNPFWANPIMTASLSWHAISESQLKQFVLAAMHTHSSVLPLVCGEAPPWHEWPGVVVVAGPGVGAGIGGGVGPEPTVAVESAGWNVADTSTAVVCTGPAGVDADAAAAIVVVVAGAAVVVKAPGSAQRYLELAGPFPNGSPSA